MLRPSRFAAVLALAVGGGAAQEPERIVAPRLWDEAALADWALPVAGLGEPPAFVSPERYYRAPVDNLRTYPVYHPSHEPAGYREDLVRRGPQPLIEPATLHTEADWIAAGQRVFDELDVPRSRTDDPVGRRSSRSNTSPGAASRCSPTKAAESAIHRRTTPTTGWWRCRASSRRRTIRARRSST